MKELVLTCGETVLLDDEDYERIPKSGWYLSRKECHNPNTDYAQHDTYGKMHRWVLGIAPNEMNNYEVDHLNHNGLDNRKENLRLVPTFINKRNVDNTAPKNILKYKGLALEVVPSKHTYRVRARWSEDSPFLNKDGKKRAKQSVKNFPFRPDDPESVRKAVKDAILYRNKMCRLNGYLLDERSTTIENAILQDESISIEELLGINLKEIVASRVGSSESKKESP